jgi:lipopolysaccharide export system permease protein
LPGCVRLPLYMRGFYASVCLQILAMMGLVEAIFLAERIPQVFRDVLRDSASPLDTILIFLCTTTQIFDLALPIAILAAIYATTLRLRENRELLVLSTAGVGPYRLITMTLVVAFAGLIGSLSVSGVLDPLARYASRAILFHAELGALQTGSDSGQFHVLQNRVTYSPAVTGPRGSHRLFVYDDVSPGSFRVITADTAILDGPDAAGMMLLRLGGVIRNEFNAHPAGGEQPATCPSCDPPDALRADSYDAPLAQDELLTFPPRGSDPAERTLVDQPPAHESQTQHIAALRQVSERFARSLLCLLAPLVALVSVCATVRRTNFIMLPVACLGLMAVNVAGQSLITLGTPGGLLEALALPAAAALLVGMALLLTVVRGYSNLVRPKLARV